MFQSTRSVCTAGAVLLLSLATLSGCVTRQNEQPRPLAAPAADVKSRVFAGSPLSGELTQSIDPTTASKVWAVRIHAAAVRQLPAMGFSAIGPKATLVLSDRGSSLMNPSTRLAYSTLIQSPDVATDVLADIAADARVDLSDSRGSVAPGTTLAIEIAQPTPATHSVRRKRITLMISRAPTAEWYQVALVSDDCVAPPGGPSTGAPVDVRETVVTRRQKFTDSDRFALAIPMDFGASEANGLVIDVSVNAKPDDAAALATSLKADIDASSARLAAKLKQPATSADDLMTFALVDSLASTAAAPRGTLVYAAQQTSAKLTESVAMVADDRVLSLIMRSVRDRIPKLAARDRATVAWMLDRATIQAIASIKDEDTARALAAVQGALINYAGEAGRQLDLLQSLANQSTSSEDLYRRLIAEHLTFLEDNSPPARVRAFDWLRDRNLAPPDYDPLAPMKTRQAALERYQESLATTRPVQQP